MFMFQTSGLRAPTSYPLSRKSNLWKTFRDMGIPDAMGAPCPATGIFCGCSFFIRIEAGEVNAPHIIIFWWNRTLIAFGQPLHTFPGKCQLYCPFPVAVLMIVQGTVDKHGALHAREFKVPRAIAQTTRVVLESYAIEITDKWICKTQIGDSTKSIFLISVFPHKKGFVPGI